MKSNIHGRHNAFNVLNYSLEKIDVEIPCMNPVFYYRLDVFIASGISEIGFISLFM